jgi:hypothetical protein
MLVSKNALPGIRVSPVEDESWRQRTPQLAETGQRTFSGGIAAYFEGSVPSDANFDLISLFQFEGLYDRRRQANRKAVSPL